MRRAVAQRLYSLWLHSALLALPPRFPCYRIPTDQRRRLSPIRGKRQLAHDQTSTSEYIIITLYSHCVHRLYLSASYSPNAVGSEANIISPLGPAGWQLIVGYLFPSQLRAMEVLGVVLSPRYSDSASSWYFLQVASLISSGSSSPGSFMTLKRQHS